MELSEEEKKAIDYLKNDLEMTKQMGKKYGFQEGIKNKEIALNLIEKQQKEIEELKKPKYLVHFENNKITKMELINDYISKDKIRERIKNIEDIYKKEMKPYQTEFGLNVSLLSKKEKEELINKRNGLLAQKITLEELLEGN